MGVPVTPVELVVTLIRSVELVGIPVIPLEQEGSDNLSPDCPLHPLLVAQQTSASTQDTVPFLGQSSTLEPRPKPGYEWRAGGLGQHRAER